VNWIAADILRVLDGILVEHWDVIQDEATEVQSKSGRPMFGVEFPGAEKTDSDQRDEDEDLSACCDGTQWGQSCLQENNS
jgi:hypothetical protein